MSEPSQQQREDRTTFLHAFKQQIMKAWQPVPTLNSTIIIFSILCNQSIIQTINSIQKIQKLIYSIIILNNNNIKQKKQFKVQNVIQKMMFQKGSHKKDIYYNRYNQYNKQQIQLQQQKASIFLIFGIVLIVYTQKIIDYSVRYDTKCSEIKYPDDKGPFTPAICNVDVTVTEDMDGPVFVYYELHNFYQNHRRYVKSKNVNQLQGEGVSKSDLTDCEPIVTYGDLKKYRYLPTGKFDDDQIASPCGLIAASLFNDTYILSPKGQSNTITISAKDIAWPSDRSNKYKNRDLNLQWLNVEDERFMVWMRTAALPTFRKLWGRIEDGLKKGTYSIQIENNYPVDTFDGKKYFVLSTANAFGGRNSFLAIAYLVMGIICFLILVVFLVKKIKYNKQKSQKEK